MKNVLIAVVLAMSMAGIPAVAGDSFKLASPDIAEGQSLDLKHLLNAFGCTGGNVSPALQWSGAPTGTKSFVVTAYDPDATSGSGWWHWVVYNIPADVTALRRNAGSGEGLPEGAVQGITDFGTRGFAGACPPPGEVHRYQFSVHALNVEKLEVGENATPAMIGFMTRANAIAVANLTAVLTR